jgi:Protein of unknown function (DUF2939)
MRPRIRFQTCTNSVYVTSKMRLIRWLVIICVIALLAYGASPYFSFWQFTVAIRSGDAAAISSRVNFPAVRASLKRQLVARFARETSGHKRWSNLGPTLIDAIVDAYVTPEGIAALLSNPEALKNLRTPREFHFTLGNDVKVWNVKYAFFTGARSFVVDRDGMKLRFHFTGSSWQLYDLELGLTEEQR